LQKICWQPLSVGEKKILEFTVFFIMSVPHEIPAPTTNGRGYEESDANVSALAKFGIGLAVIAVVVLALMFWLQNFFSVQAKRATPPPSPLAVQRQAPPAPLLQVAPEKDLQQVHATEDSILHNYGKVTSDASVVRIPIERAMELVAQRGLPVRAEGGGQRAEGKAREAKGEVQQ
jgi:hypothetical protein